MRLLQLVGTETRDELVNAVRYLRDTKERSLNPRQLRDDIDSDVDELVYLVRDMDTAKRLATRAGNVG